MHGFLFGGKPVRLPLSMSSSSSTRREFFHQAQKTFPKKRGQQKDENFYRAGTYDRRIYKSHVLRVWNIYLHLSVNFRLKGSHSADFDDLVRQLLPMFVCSLFRFPVRILNRKEVVTLSGLSGHWTKVIPEWLITVVSKSPKSGCSILNGHSWLINGGDPNHLRVLG